MARLLRGEVRWARLGDTSRAVLILSEPVFNEHSGTAICAALTSAEPAAEFPLYLRLSSRALPRPAWVCIGQVQTISTERIGDRAGRASAEELALVLEGLREITGA